MIRGLNNFQRNEMKKLIKYCLYGYGIPLLLLTIVMIVEFTDLSQHVHLGIGNMGCIISSIKK
jgi:hypothetical protein